MEVQLYALLNLALDGSGQLHNVAALPPEAGWTPEPVWTWWLTEKFPDPAGT